MKLNIEVSQLVRKLAMTASATERQPLLVDLLALMVDIHTDGGRMVRRDEWPKSHGWWGGFEHELKALGFNLLGAGHFSAAFSHKGLPGRVIKVGLKKEDSGAAYAAWCRQHQGQEGVPNIHDIQRHQSCYTVVMDKLYEFRTSTAEAKEVAKYRIALLISNPNSDLNWAYRARENRTVYPEFAKTCDDIRSFFKGIASFDLHDDNVMLDGNGNLVIIDPVSFTECKQKVGDFNIELPEVDANPQVEQWMNKAAPIEFGAPSKVWGRKMVTLPGANIVHALDAEFLALDEFMNRDFAKPEWRKPKGFQMFDRSCAGPDLHFAPKLHRGCGNRTMLQQEQLARKAMGTRHFANVWLQNPKAQFDIIEANKAAVERLRRQHEIAALKPLRIDLELDKFLMNNR